MKYALKYTDEAKEDIERLKNNGEISALKKLRKLIFELQEHPAQPRKNFQLSTVKG
jgi:mRNA-degrading endonuclease RelE of RelBE toxin-antitoxin system